MGVPLQGDFLQPGTPVDRDNCAREPIHTPGAIQPHGVLLATDAEGTVVQASDNAAMVFGDAPVLGTRTALPAAGRGAVNGVPVDVVTYPGPAGGTVVELEPIPPDDPGDTADFATDLARATAALRDADDVDALLATAVRVVHELTGFDRVWAYRFEPDDHGVIVAEERALPGIPSFLGLHYPATDIPVQARALFLVNRVRLIPDVAGAPASITPLVHPATGEWLDLSEGVLRAVSPMHIAYLRNMGATASMSIALEVDGRLWGLLSAHHYSGPRRLSQRTRAACELLGTVCSVTLRALEELERARVAGRRAEHRATLLERVTRAQNIADGLTDSPAELLAVCDADGAAVRIGSVLRTAGETPDEAELLALAPGDDVWSTDDAPGTLVAPLSGGNYIAWFRREWEHTITWGGKEAAGRADGSTLNPEASWREWTETVAGRSRPWTGEDRAAAAALRSALGTLLLGRAEQLAAINTELARSNAELDAFAYVVAHDLREPLRGVHNFTSFAVEDHGDALGPDGLEQLGTVTRLAERMNGLLDSLLEYSRVGRAELRETDVTLSSLIADVRQMLHTRLSAPDAELVLEGDAELHGDEDGLLQILVNLVSNGLKYNRSQPRRVVVDVCTLADTARGEPVSELPPERPPVVVRVRDNGIGIPAAHRETIFAVFRRLHGRDEYGGGTGAGLTIAQRIAERHGGALWVDASGDDGTTFCFTVPA